MRISPREFFDYYISNPLAKDLFLTERMAVLALSILIAVPTLGVFHFRSLYLRHKNIQIVSELRTSITHRFEQIAATIEKVRFKILPPNEKILPFTIADVPHIVQEQLIDKRYAIPLPKEEDVTVPCYNPKTEKKEWKKWCELTREEKIDVNNRDTREHNQLPKWTPEPVVDWWFFGHGQKPFLPGDPKKDHGNDHAIGTSIGTALFAYLYHKYHPQYDLSAQDIAISMIVGAGHDAGRQTEGPDVYDDMSAEITCKVLKEIGVQDSAILQQAYDAIAHKDSDPLDPNKSLMAKCIQNADSAEFARLLLTHSPKQDDAEFEASRKYLDIFKELSVLAQEKSSFVLKNGLTYGDFCYELDTLRQEMNAFIFQKHSRDFREKVISSEKSGYQFLLDEITSYEYPAINNILLKIGIKTETPALDDLQKKKDLRHINAWITLGLDKTATDTLIEMQSRLAINTLPEAKILESSVICELEMRKSKEKAYLQALSTPNLITSYANLPPILKKTHFNDFIERLPQPIEDLYPPDSQALITCLLEVKASKLEETLEKIEEMTHSESLLIEIVDSLKALTQETLSLYQQSNEFQRRAEIQTTIALALGKISHLYLELGKTELAKETLQIAATSIQIEKTHPLANPENLLKLLPGDSAKTLLTDCGLVKRRKIGIAKKELDNKPYYEFTVELPAATRNRLEKVFENLIPIEQKSHVPALYYKKKQLKNKPEPLVNLGTDLKIDIAPGIVILIGQDRKVWNQYHLMRIQVDPHVSMQEVHKALSTIGIPATLMPSRESDIKREMMTRSIAFRFPSLLHQQLSPTQIYKQLTEEQKNVVDNDIKESKLCLVGNNHFEAVQPQIASEAWKLGVRSVGCFMRAGSSFESAAETMCKIIQNDLSSSLKRFQEGIGGGCCPDYNFQTGSGNQVFTRILTKNLFEGHYDLSQLACEGQIFIMMRPQVLERMPYSYIKDRAGLRNPHLHVFVHDPEKQIPEFNYRGVEKIQERLGFTEHVEELLHKYSPTNESMIHLDIGSHYFERLVVSTENERTILLKTLKKAGIHEIGGTPIEKAVIAETHLRPELVDGYYEENPYTERGYDPRYSSFC